MSIVIFILLATAASIATYLRGRKRGRAEGWIERHFQQVEAERACRNPDGRFKHVERKHL